jgi:CelD/BcsL family acetyltransferase involved in cellulose biosynthesis
VEGAPLVLGSPPAVREVTRMPLPAALALGPDTWDAVLARSPFMSWAWHRAWMDCAPAAEVETTDVLALRGADESLQALLPIRACRVQFRRVWVRALTWAIGDVGCPDALDVPASAHADWSTLATALDELPWQIVMLSNLAEHAPNAKQLCAALARRGHAVRSGPLWTCPRLELPLSWDAYLATLSANRRQILRRKERSLFRDHAAQLVDYDEDRLDEGWAHLLRLHAQRWDHAGGGAFRDPRSARMQREFAGRMAKRQQLWLTTLNVDGQPAAAWYGFTSADTVYFYQGGRDPRWERESVGFVLMGMMIRRAIERGYRAFDFLRGDDPYKQQWTTTRRKTTETVIFRSGWGSLWLRALDAAAAAVRAGGPRDG